LIEIYKILVVVVEKKTPDYQQKQWQRFVSEATELEDGGRNEYVKNRPHNKLRCDGQRNVSKIVSNKRHSSLPFIYCRQHTDGLKMNEELVPKLSVNSPYQSLTNTIKDGN